MIMEDVLRDYKVGLQSCYIAIDGPSSVRGESNDPGKGSLMDERDTHVGGEANTQMSEL